MFAPSSTFASNLRLKVDQLGAGLRPNQIVSNNIYMYTDRHTYTYTQTDRQGEPQPLIAATSCDNDRVEAVVITLPNDDLSPEALI